jgi:hypothetical protein
MRQLIIAGLALSAVLTASEQVHAVEYPWCTTESGTRQCVFSSREECAASSTRGFGSSCFQNPSFRGAMSAADQANRTRPARRQPAKRNSDQ